MMPFTPEQVMLTLAGLTYRGFADPGAADGHDGRVRAAVEAGLRPQPSARQWLSNALRPTPRSGLPKARG